ncbi:hypothetical protein GGR53DRAFT_465462 [Hypoxylon sp. FL1150]|nr:hypothetical protein GGR53DRAFT_465462 [Hypoxylon sp. FL1150]
MTLGLFAEPTQRRLSCHNVGLGQIAGASSVTEQYRQIFEINVFGAVTVTEAFLPRLRASSHPDLRIVNVTSGLGLYSMAGKKEKAFNVNAWNAPDYRSSKATLNMIIAAQSVKLASGEVAAVIAAVPGMCRTKLTSGQGRKEVSDEAKVIMRAATEGNPGELSRTMSLMPGGKMSPIGKCCASCVHMAARRHFERY